MKKHFHANFRGVQTLIRGTLEIGGRDKRKKISITFENTWKIKREKITLNRTLCVHARHEVSHPMKIIKITQTHQTWTLSAVAGNGRSEVVLT